MLVLAVLALSAAPGLRMDVAAGLGGFYRPGQWLPVSVTLENHEGSIEGSLEIELPPARLSTPLALPAPARKRLDLTLPAPWKPGVLRVSVRVGEHVVVSSTAAIEPIPAATPLEIHVIEDVELSFRATPLPRILADARVVTVRPDHIPDRWKALEAASVVVLSRGAEEALREEQKQALRRWSSLGGELRIEDVAVVAPRFPGNDESPAVEKEAASTGFWSAGRIGLFYFVSIALLQLFLALSRARLGMRLWVSTLAALSFIVFFAAGPEPVRRDRSVVLVAPGLDEAYVEGVVSIAFARSQEVAIDAISPDVFFEPLEPDRGLSYESEPDGRLRVSGARYRFERESLRFYGFTGVPFVTDGTRVENLSARVLTACAMGSGEAKPLPDIPPGGVLRITNAEVAACDSDFAPELLSFGAVEGRSRVVFRLNREK